MRSQHSASDSFLGGIMVVLVLVVVLLWGNFSAKLSSGREGGAGEVEPDDRMRRV